MKNITDQPALVLDDIEYKTLVVADLHLGLEYEIYKKGISIPSRIEKQKTKILKLIEKTDVKRLVLLGDVKHNVPQMSFNERKKLPGFFQQLSEKIKVWIIKGNHDGNIEDIANCAKIFPSSGTKIDKYYLMHGQAWPSADICDCEELIMGHLHPAISFKDRLGYTSKLSCWLKATTNNEKIKERFKNEKINLKNATVMPAFNDLITGRPLNTDESKGLGPITTNKIIEIDESEVQLLDGTYLGKIKDLK